MSIYEVHYTAITHAATFACAFQSPTCDVREYLSHQGMLRVHSVGA